MCVVRVMREVQQAVRECKQREGVKGRCKRYSKLERFIGIRVKVHDCGPTSAQRMGGEACALSSWLTGTERHRLEDIEWPGGSYE